MNHYQKKRLITEQFFSRLSSDDKIEWAAHRKACDRSLFFFIREVGGSVPKSGGDISTTIHKPICDWWQDRSITRKACYMPRSWKKSTMLTQWGNLWEYLKNNEVRILIPSEKEDKAIDWVMWIEGQVLHNARLRWLYPELTMVDESYTRKVRWSGKKCQLPRAGVYPEATISIIGIRGGAQGGHYDIIAPDDMVGEKGMESTLVLEDSCRWFDNIEGLLIEKDPAAPDASIIRIVGTHWAPGDMGHYIQQNYPEYKWKIVPCLKDESLKDTDNITWVQHPDVANGESNWPEMFQTSIYTDMMANPQQSLTFWSQYMNNPKNSDLSTFDVSWLKYYDWEELDGQKYMVFYDDNGKVEEKLRLGSFLTYGIIDPGGFSEKKVTKTASRSAILCGGQPPGSNKKIVTHAWAGKFKSPDIFLNSVFDAALKAKPTLMRQEIFGQQRYILEDIKKESRKRGIPLRIIELESDERKDAKALNIEGLKDPMFRGEIYVHKSMKELIGEVQVYPNGMTCDLLDCLAKLNQHYFKRDKKPELAGPRPSSEYKSLVSTSRTGY